MFRTQLAVLFAFALWLPSQASVHYEPANQGVSRSLMRSRAKAGKSPKKDSDITDAKTQGLMRKGISDKAHADGMEVSPAVEGKLLMRKRSGPKFVRKH